MAIGLTFEEYVEIKLVPPNHADTAILKAFEQIVACSVSGVDQSNGLACSDAWLRLPTKKHQIALIHRADRILPSCRPKHKESDSC
jgi:hypothetical protein